VVVELIQERRAAGVAVIGIFHDNEVRQQVCDRELKMGKYLSPV
jgi:alpha-D-ribose 1-methylphosphonate 5-triphosphate synthase subunit PhnL